MVSPVNNGNVDDPILDAVVLTNYTSFILGLNRFLHATLSAFTNIFNRTFKLSFTAIVIATTNVRIFFVVINNYILDFLQTK
ncbi:hypothetical protein B8W99_27950 [Peribacillus simplex]|nr:hypothetical protein B8W99_27950 [Peribacillus simplex]